MVQISKSNQLKEVPDKFLKIEDVDLNTKGKLYIIYYPLPNNPTKTVDVFNSVRVGNALNILGHRPAHNVKGAFMRIGSRRKKEQIRYISIKKPEEAK